MSWLSDLFGGGSGPQMPTMPSILQAPPVPQPLAQMPMPTSPGVKLAGQAYDAAAQARNGRASTILTARKKKAGQDTSMAAPGFDTYSSPTL